MSPPSPELEWVPRDAEDRGGRGEITEAGLTAEGTGHDGEAERAQDLELGLST